MDTQQIHDRMPVRQARDRSEVRGVLQVKCPTCGREAKRSDQQNNISHAWYEQLAKELREDDALGWKCYCKLHHGVPILRAEDSEYREIYDATIKGMSYAKKLMVMTQWPVTSVMTKSQLSAYLEAVQADFLTRGVKLEFPNE